MVIVWCILVGIAGLSLLWIGKTFRKSNPDIHSFQWKYQSATLVIGLALLGISGIFGQWISLLGNLSAPVTGLAFLGVTPSDTWTSIGLTFAAVMALVTLTVVLLQTGKSTKVPLRVIAINVPIVLIFSLTNSLTEELIFRVALIQGIDHSIPYWIIALISAVLFGGLHYFGKPGRIPGVLMAGFMAWLLSYSIIQTGGIFWAWFIHFVQDVIILSIVFATSQMGAIKTKTS